MTRIELLEAAQAIVCNDREAQYGKPEDNFKLIGKLWSVYLSASMENPIRDIAPEEVAMMLALLKIARIATGAHKDDNYIDLAGYAACGGEVASKAEKNDAIKALKKQCAKYDIMNILKPSYDNADSILMYFGESASKEWRDAVNDPPDSDDTVLICLVNQKGESYRYTVGAYGNKTWTWEYQNQPKDVVLRPALWQPINFVQATAET